MQIDRQNYEAFFLDYIEGKLNTAEVERLMNFLAKNPDLKAELDNYEPIKLVPDTNIFIEKDLLKKSSEDIQTVNDSNFDELCICRIEGILNKNIELIFDAYLEKYPDKLKEYNQYLKTVLEPDKGITFEEKRKLKHFALSSKRTILYISWAAAASIILMFFVYRFNSGSPEIGNNKFSDILINNSKISAKKEIIKEATKKIATRIHKLNLPLKIGMETSEINHDYVQVKKQNIHLQQKASIEISQLKAPLLQIALVNPNYINKAFLHEAIKADSSGDERYLTLSKLAENEISKVINKENLPVDQGLNLWALAKSGIREINRLTGSKIVLDKTQDTTSTRKKFELDTGLLGFYSSSEK
jgi:hypothetical protein